MSFYTGKDNNGDVILHITNGVTPQSSMKSGVLANSIFHSSLPYLEVEEYQLTRVSSTRLEAPIAFINAVNENNPYFITVDNVLQNQAMGMTTYIWEDINGNTSGGLYNYPNNTYKYIKKDSTTSNNYGYIIKNILNRNYVPFIPTQNDILIGNGNFNVKGKNLNITKYIQNGVLNSVDRVINTNQAPIQIINSVNAHTSNLEIVSTPAETYIARNNHKVFSSNVNTKSKYLAKTPQQHSGWVNRSPSFYGGCGISGGYSSPEVLMLNLGVGYQEGDMVLIDWEPNASSRPNAKYDTCLVKYKEGFITLLSAWEHQVQGEYFTSITYCCYDACDGTGGWVDCGWTDYCNGSNEVTCGYCSDSGTSGIDILAFWILRGESGVLKIYSQANYALWSSGGCRCDYYQYQGWGIFAQYDVYASTIKFY